MTAAWPRPARSPAACRPAPGRSPRRGARRPPPSRLAPRAAARPRRPRARRTARPRPRHPRRAAAPTARAPDTRSRAVPPGESGWSPARPGSGRRTAAARSAARPRSPGARSCPAPAAPAAPPPRRPARPRPAGPRIRPRRGRPAPQRAAAPGSVTGTRSTYQIPPNRSATSAATASASLVLPIPPGPTAETSRDAPSAVARAARSPSRPTNEVNGAGSRGGAASPGPATAARYPAARRTSSRWVPIFSLRRSEATWLSTVRTEMNSRAAISAWLSCSPSKASTSVSRPDTPASARADALVTGATRSSLPQIRSGPRRIRGYYGCRGRPRARTLSAGQVTGHETGGGSHGIGRSSR